MTPPGGRKELISTMMSCALIRSQSMLQSASLGVVSSSVMRGASRSSSAQSCSTSTDHRHGRNVTATREKCYSDTGEMLQRHGRNVTVTRRNVTATREKCYSDTEKCYSDTGEMLQRHGRNVTATRRNVTATREKCYSDTEKCYSDTGEMLQRHGNVKYTDTFSLHQVWYVDNEQPLLC